MNNEVNEYSTNQMYLREIEFFNGEYDITFTILDINTEKMNITLAVTNLGKISVIEYELKRDKEDNLYFEYGCEHSKIDIDEFEKID